MRFWPFGGDKSVPQGNVETGITAAELFSADGGLPGDPSFNRTLTQDQALRIAAVYRAVAIISETIASLPFNVLETGDRYSKVVSDHPIARVIGKRPNGVNTPVVFWQLMIASALLRGNGYAEIKIQRDGKFAELHWLHPDKVQPLRHNGENIYKVTRADNQVETLPQDFVIHVPGMSFDGVTGLSALQSYARGAINGARETESHGSIFYQNAAKPSGVVILKGKSDASTISNLRASFRKQYQGRDNAGNVVVLDGDANYTQIGLSPEDAQLIESRRFQIEDIARAFGVPLHLLMENSKSTSWGAGLSENTQGFIRFTLRPWMTRVEQEVGLKLLIDDYAARFNVEALMRGTPKERMEFYKTALLSGWMTPNEVREKENLPPVEGGDQLMIPQNMAMIDMLLSDSEKDKTNDQNADATA